MTPNGLKMLQIMRERRKDRRNAHAARMSDRLRGDFIREPSWKELRRRHPFNNVRQAAMIHDVIKPDHSYQMAWEDRSNVAAYKGKICLFVRVHHYDRDDRWNVTSIHKAPAKTLEARKNEAECIVERMFDVLAGVVLVRNPKFVKETV